jgi:hypothetical protein
VTISTEQLLNSPEIRVLSVQVEEHLIGCEIESTQGYSICHRQERVRQAPDNAVPRERS